jgi:hypothetical protein
MGNPLDMLTFGYRKKFSGALPGTQRGLLRTLVLRELAVKLDIFEGLLRFYAE